jgi:hypothetical protein
MTLCTNTQTICALVPNIHIVQYQVVSYDARFLEVMGLGRQESAAAMLIWLLL